MKATNRAGNLKRITTHSRRKLRQTEALLRQAMCDGMSLLVRLNRLDKGGFRATKERAKLAKLASK